MKKICLAILILSFFNTSYAVDKKIITSPDGKIKVTIEANGNIFYSVTYENKTVLLPSIINLTLENGIDISGKIDLKKTSIRNNNSIVISPIPEKRRNIPDIYNELTVRFKIPFSIIFRVYNDGVAYRFLSHIKDSIIVKQEAATFNFPANHFVYYPEVVKRDNADIYHTSFEEPYQLTALHKKICVLHLY